MINEPECCLQINLCPGDVAYAPVLVPRLLRAHQGLSPHRLAVVDCHKPALTRANRNSGRYAEPGFSERCLMIKRLAERLKADGLLDEVVLMEPGTDETLRQEMTYCFTGGTVPASATHDYHGAALTAYWAALHLPQHRYVIHYDADILLYEQQGFDWAAHALEEMKSEPSVVFASPRTSPPGHTPDAPSCHEGRPLNVCHGGWLNDWFSTRCFLADRERLASHLPLVRGRLKIETLIYRVLKRRYPPSPEILLFRSAGARGARRLNLASHKAWLLHPTSKPEAFLANVEKIAQRVEKGLFPKEQTGHSELQLDAWLKFIGTEVSSS